jgi:hypothetical protein
MRIHHSLGNLGLGGFPALVAAALVAAILLPRGATAQQLTTLYSFNGDDGASPRADLIADPQSLRHDRWRGRRYELRSGLRYRVRADRSGEFYRRPGESKYDHEAARSMSAADGPPVTMYRLSNKKPSSTIRIRRQSAACSRVTSS